MIDFHSHVLPAIDDGSRDFDMTTQMLLESKEQGVETLVATPHYYPNKINAELFLERRNNAYSLYMNKLDEQIKIPEIVLGAEVYFCNGISNLKELDLLAIGDTNYILLELPFESWSKRVFDEINSIISDRGLKPIIAHFERYIGLQNDHKNINRLFDMEVVIQSNAEYFIGFWTRRKALNYLKNNIIELIGSDCHNMTKRPPNLGVAYEIINKKCGKDVVDKLNRNASKILRGISEK